MQLQELLGDLRRQDEAGVIKNAAETDAVIESENWGHVVAHDRYLVLGFKHIEVSHNVRSEPTQQVVKGASWGRGPTNKKMRKIFFVPRIQGAVVELSR